MRMRRTRKISPRPRVTHRKIYHETATRVGPRDESTRGKKRKAQSDEEAVRTRLRTESVNQLSDSQSDPKQQLVAETPEGTKSVLVSISRGESILDR